MKKFRILCHIIFMCLSAHLFAEETIPLKPVDLNGNASDMGGILAAGGKITGVISSVDTGGFVEGARVSVLGTENATMSKKNGQYELNVPEGTYEIKVAHPNYYKKNQKDINVKSGSSMNINFDMSLSGSGVIEELIATAAYIPVIEVEQKRDASSILDSISSEQFSKMGDSDAASALKRVSGVSLVGGQYAVVRGLTGRYISSTLNGGSIPSTNPLSRDVALDLFPSSVLQGIEIKKSYTPNLPGDSTGGSINLVTKGIPDERIAKFKIGTGFRTGVTGNDVISYEGGGKDFLGIDDGSRDMPDLIDSSTHFAQESYTVCDDPSICIVPAQAASYGKSLKNNYNTSKKTAGPDLDLGISYGNLLDQEFGGIGYYGDVNYKSKWGARQDAETHGDGDFTYERSKRNIDVSLYGVLGYKDISTNNEILSKSIVLRKTDDTTKDTRGKDTESTPIQEVTLQWVERSYLGQTFSGKHFFNEKNHEISWQTTVGQSNLYEPDRRNYQFRNNQIFPSTLERRYSKQKQDNVDFSADYAFNWQISSDISAKLMAGLFQTEKNRKTDVGRLGVKQGLNAVTAGLDLESLLIPENFDDRDFTLAVKTAKTDSYEAKDDMFAYYVNSEIDFSLAWTLLAGVRFEDAEQELLYPSAPKSNDLYKTKESLPAVSLTWKATEELQLRAGYSKTLSRPGLTERSLSSQYDPETDEQVFGNKELVFSSIDNLDFRAEYYFSDEDSLSVGYFTKNITNPIERTVPDASGSAANGYTFVNQDSAVVSGFEFEIQQSVFETDTLTGNVSSNLSLLDSEVSLSGRSIPLEGGITKRKLQGQSDVLGNIQFEFVHLPSEQTITFLLNYFDDRIKKVGRGGRNEMEKGRSTIDVVYKYQINVDWVLAGKIQNLLDEKVVYTIFDEVSESYREGTYLSMNFDYSF